MNFQKIKLNKICFVLLAIFAMATFGFGQEVPKVDMPVAGSNNLYCAGYIQSNASFDTGFEVVGAEEEKDKHIYSQGDMLYIGAGTNRGLKVGDMFSVIRPRGKFRNKHSKKKRLGTFVEEVGAVELVKVMREVSVARVKTSCAIILLGDLLKQIPQRTSPRFEKRPALDKFAMSSGKASGKIIMARDGLEMLAREQIVYIDLGRVDNVRVGDYLTIYRPLGTGNIYKGTLAEQMDHRNESYQSDRYRGGGYSNQAPRKKGARTNSGNVRSKDAKKGRPKELRRVVGELVILNVLEKTATAVIVRTASEIHTGDRVELQ